MNLSLSATTAPAGLGWTITYPSTITSASISAGTALTSAGKGLNCNPMTGSIVCVASNSNTTIPNGVVAVLNATLASTVGSSSVAISVSKTAGALADGTAQAISGTGGSISVTGTQSTPTLSALSCSPQTLVTPTSTSCTVSLSGTAGSPGLSVALYKSASALTVPLSVVVANGASSANFNVSAATVSTTETDSITASLNGASTATSLVLQPTSAGTSGLAAAYAFDETSGSVATDSSDAAGTAQVNGATWTPGEYANGLSFNGSSNYADLGTPASLQTSGSMSWSAWVYPTGVPADDGQIVARSDDATGWQLKTTPDTGVRTFGIAVSGAAGSRTQRYSKTVLALNTWYHVAGVYNASAQTLDIYVNGVLDNGTLTGTVPASQVVPSLNTTVGVRSGGYYFKGVIDNLRIYTRALSSADVQNDMNTAIGGTAPAPAQPAVSTLQCSPASVASGATSSCTVTLSAAAPSGGAAVTLSDNSAALTVPASVTVASGATTATFTANTGSVTSDQAVTITAGLNGSSASASLTIVAPAPSTAKLSSVTCSPSSVASGSNSTCTVTLSQAAPSGGAAVTLSDNSAALTVPASVTVASGAATATFTATAGSVTSDQAVTITAGLNGSSASASLAIVAPAPSATAKLSSVTCSPSSIASGSRSTCTVTLSQAAPAGGAVVAVADQCSTLTVPASVTIGAGSTSATFTAAAGSTSRNHTDTITASWSGITVSTYIKHRR